MNYIVVASPDKLSISMFIRFLRTNFKKHMIGEMHNLMSDENIKNYIENFSSLYPQGIISYYALKKINTDLLKVIPTMIQKWADVVVWFDLYSVEMNVIKDKDAIFSGMFQDKWKQFNAQFNID